MINPNHHPCRCGPNENYDLSDEDMKNTDKLRKHIEPWLTAVFQRNTGEVFSSCLLTQRGSRSRLQDPFPPCQTEVEGGLFDALCAYPENDL